MGSKNTRLAPQTGNRLPGRPDLPTVGSMRATLKQIPVYKPQGSISDRQTDDSVAVDYRYLEIAGCLPKVITEI